MSEEVSPVGNSGLLTRVTSADQGQIRFPQLTPHLQFRTVEGQRALLISESFNTLLQGRLSIELLPLLDGTRSIEQIVASLAKSYSKEEVERALSFFQTKGYVVSGQHDLTLEEAAFWSTMGASPCWVEHSFKTKQIAIEGEQKSLLANLRHAGLRVDNINPALKIVVCEDYLEERLNQVNQDQLDKQQAWLLIRPTGAQPLLGPLFKANDEGPCWDCLQHRLRSHQEVHNYLRNVQGEGGAFKPFAANPTAQEVFNQLITLEITKWVVFSDSTVISDHVVAFNSTTLTTTQHRVVRRPQCFTCGDTEFNRPDRPPAKLELQESPKAHQNSGGDRTVPPEATLAKYKHLISPITGVVSWLTCTTDDAEPWLHVYWAGTNMGVRARTLSSLRRSLRSKSAGKGSTREQAEVSALCEGIERYSGIAQGDEIKVNRSFIDFEAEANAIHPNTVQLFSDSQLDNAASINAEGHPYNVIPQRFDPEVAVDWTPVWSLTDERHIYLPTSSVYGMAAEDRSHHDLIADSNGCAAGNTREEAVLQGLYELIERDAFAIWWYNELRLPKLDLCSFDDPYLSSIESFYEQYERELWVLDMTSDLEIPSFVALSRTPNQATENIIYGAGTHLNPRLAALRAVCELNQCLTWLPRPGKRDGKPMIDDPHSIHWWANGRLEDCSWLKPDDTQEVRTLASHIFAETDDSRDDVETCRKVLEDKNLELLVLDQTRADIGMPVVRVIVPGLRHFWARYAPGRLYDVPVTTGLLTQPLEEKELNPVPVIA